MAFFHLSLFFSFQCWQYCQSKLLPLLTMKNSNHFSRTKPKHTVFTCKKEQKKKKEATWIKHTSVTHLLHFPFKNDFAEKKIVEYRLLFFILYSWKIFCMCNTKLLKREEKTLMMPRWNKISSITFLEKRKKFEGIFFIILF